MLRAGFSVTAYDINDGLQDTVNKESLPAGLSVCRVISTRFIPTGNFDVAVFAETTASRLHNFKQFLSHAKAAHILLEKSMSADPGEVWGFHAVALAHVVADITQVNFVRRHWPHLHRLAKRCAREERFTVTPSGGEIGVGCMGIKHGFDNDRVLWLGQQMARTLGCRLRSDAIRNGRTLTAGDMSLALPRLQERKQRLGEV